MAMESLAEPTSSPIGMADRQGRPSMPEQARIRRAEAWMAATSAAMPVSSEGHWSSHDHSSARGGDE